MYRNNICNARAELMNYLAYGKHFLSTTRTVQVEKHCCVYYNLRCKLKKHLAKRTAKGPQVCDTDENKSNNALQILFSGGFFGLTSPFNFLYIVGTIFTKYWYILPARNNNNDKDFTNQIFPRRTGTVSNE